MPLSTKHAELLRTDPLCIVDVGARGGLRSHWAHIREHCLFVGFEAESSEAERLKREAAPNEFYVGSALHREEGTVLFHHCVSPTRSSFYTIDPEVVTDICGTAEPFRIVRTEAMRVTTLDALIAAGSLPHPQFIKLDTQGTELDILRGATASLDSLIGIEAEAEFLPVYKGQPVYAELDTFLRGHGFQFMGFLNLHSKADIRFRHRGEAGYRNALEFLRTWGARLIPPSGSLTGRSQLVYADVLYMRRVREYLRDAQRGGANPVAAIVRAVLVATQFRAHGYAFDVLAEAANMGLIDENDRADLDRYVTGRSRDVTPLFDNIRRQAERLVHRLRNPQRR